MITPETNLWHCLGACNTGGSVIDWVMKSEGVSFRHAVELLREQPVLQSALTGSVIKKSTVPKLASPLAADVGDQQLLQRVVTYYHETLKQSPDALAYLAARGLNHPECIAHFQLGYQNNRGQRGMALT